MSINSLNGGIIHQEPKKVVSILSNHNSLHVFIGLLVLCTYCVTYYSKEMRIGPCVLEYYIYMQCYLLFILVYYCILLYIISILLYIISILLYIIVYC